MPLLWEVKIVGANASVYTRTHPSYNFKTALDL